MYVCSYNLQSGLLDLSVMCCVMSNVCLLMQYERAVVVIMRASRVWAGW